VNRPRFLTFKCALFVALASLTTLAAAHGDDDQGWGSRGFEGRHRHMDAEAHLYDARGTLVGDVVFVSGIDYDGGVVLELHGVFVFAGFSRAGGYQTKDALSNSEFVWQYPRLAYDNPNCAGTPYVYYEGGPYRPSAIERKGNTATLYIATDTTSKAVNISSNIGSYGYCFSGAPLYVSTGWPVESTVDLTQLYPEPLRIGR
jgi:hypothetical protein